MTIEEQEKLIKAVFKDYLKIEVEEIPMLDTSILGKEELFEEIQEYLDKDYYNFSSSYIQQGDIEYHVGLILEEDKLLLGICFTQDMVVLNVLNGKELQHPVIKEGLK